MRRFFDGRLIDGTIVSWLPQGREGQPPLWHVLHDDGDSEDLPQADAALGVVDYDEDEREALPGEEDEEDEAPAVAIRPPAPAQPPQ